MHIPYMHSVSLMKRAYFRLSVLEGRKSSMFRNNTCATLRFSSVEFAVKIVCDENYSTKRHCKFFKIKNLY